MAGMKFTDDRVRFQVKHVISQAGWNDMHFRHAGQQLKDMLNSMAGCGAMHHLCWCSDGAHLCQQLLLEARRHRLDLDGGTGLTGQCILVV